DLPQLTYAITSYYNSDKEAASGCQDADKVATFASTRSYKLNPQIFGDALQVKEDNGFPEGAKAIDFYGVSYLRTYHDDTLIDHLNSNEICEVTDWATDVEQNLNLAENCSASLFMLTDRWTDPNSSPEFVDTTFSGDGLWSSPYIPGTQDFSIFK